MPLLAQAVAHIAHPAIRNRGTLGGSLALADPNAELPACALALDPDKQQVRAVTSNVGHCLACGIIEPGQTYRLQLVRQPGLVDRDHVSVAPVDRPHAKAPRSMMSQPPVWPAHRCEPAPDTEADQVVEAPPWPRLASDH